ncbi:MAG: ferrous iron transport protein A [Clostridiales bacterium]|jgi:ferrous iron transport protein A|nr:ferrous iron transport protein A [Clostridiales bacterium]MBP3809109.1 ferrous iron transport protein A [Clostridiales bacterium]MBR4493716.1 ferrous iron transport protein A [Clostridiales bacterium]
MKKLAQMKQGQTGVVTAINGDARYMSRITSIGITPGCTISIVKNDKNRPVIVYTRDTMIALNEKECNNIEVQEGS